MSSPEEAAMRKFLKTFGIGVMFVVLGYGLALAGVSPP
jgi:hypothetical protein